MNTPRRLQHRLPFVVVIAAGLVLWGAIILTAAAVL